jgi:hypothetical protein
LTIRSTRSLNTILQLRRSADEMRERARRARELIEHARAIIRQMPRPIRIPDPVQTGMPKA